jgi:hypothetical protein
VIVMLFMVFCPIVIRLIEDAGLEGSARILSYVGYTWMGLLFLFVCASLVLDFYRLAVYGINLAVHKDLTQITLSARMGFFVALLLSCSIAAYGLYAAFDIRTEHVSVKTSKIPAGIRKIRIVQITDVHLGLLVREARLGRILRAVREADPDILVSTGDLVDGQIDNMAVLAAMFREIQPKYGKFAVTGNHEYYAGIDRSLSFRGMQDLTCSTAAGSRSPNSFGLPAWMTPRAGHMALIPRSAKKNYCRITRGSSSRFFSSTGPWWIKRPWGFLICSFRGMSTKGKFFPLCLRQKCFSHMYPGSTNLNMGPLCT